MRMRVWLLVSVFLLLACGESSRVTVQTKTGMSSVLQIDRLYRSMEGPLAARNVRLEEGPPQLLWLTAYHTEVVGEDGGPISQEFMCHNNMNFDWDLHARIFRWAKPMRRGRMFTTSQGQFDVVLPEGYGIPVLSNEPLELVTQVLNHNIPELDLGVRHRISIEYVRDDDARGRLKPLYPTNAYVMALVEGSTGVFDVDSPSHLQEGAACLPGELAPQADETSLLSDRPGRQFTGHWVVPPGREERRTLVNRFLRLPFDTTVHYVATHVHPFAETLELRDLTTGETIFKTRAKAAAEGIGLAHVEPFTSSEGIPLFKDHDYEMISIYDNTSGKDQDAMATFFLYLHDKEAEAGLEAVRLDLAAGELASLRRTNAPRKKRRENAEE